MKEEELDKREEELHKREKAVEEREEEAEQRHRELNQREIEIQHIFDKLNKQSEYVKHKIKLNVGGTVFVTTRDTLASEHDSMLRAMFSEEFNTQPDEDGEVFIDRNGKHFGIILEHLRGVDVSKAIAALDPVGKHELAQEVQFYQIGSLEHFFPDVFPMTLHEEEDGPLQHTNTELVQWVDSGSNTVEHGPGLGWKLFKTDDYVDSDGGLRAEWEVEVEEYTETSNGWDIVVGVARNDHPRRTSGFDVLGYQTTRGWGLVFKSGQVLHDDTNGAPYATFRGRTGDVITIVLSGDGSLSFKYNGQDLGTAFDNLHGMQLCPAASITCTAKLRITRTI